MSRQRVSGERSGDRHSRADVVARALVVLDTWGLADLTMRRLGAELGVRPSALYHHVASKQELLAAVADEILARGPAPRPVEPEADWSAVVLARCVALREALLAYRDGAEVVATARAFGLGASAPEAALAADVASSGLPAERVPVAVRTLLHLVLGHVVAEQTELQAGSAGVIATTPRADADSDFAAGLGFVVDGIAAHTRLIADPAQTGQN